MLFFASSKIKPWWRLCLWSSFCWLVLSGCCSRFRRGSVLWKLHCQSAFHFPGAFVNFFHFLQFFLNGSLKACASMFCTHSEIHSEDLSCAVLRANACGKGSLKYCTLSHPSMFCSCQCRCWKKFVVFRCDGCLGPLETLRRWVSAMPTRKSPKIDQFSQRAINLYM